MFVSYLVGNSKQSSHHRGQSYGIYCMGFSNAHGLKHFYDVTSSTVKPGLSATPPLVAKVISVYSIIFFIILVKVKQRLITFPLALNHHEHDVKQCFEVNCVYEKKISNLLILDQRQPRMMLHLLPFLWNHRLPHLHHRLPYLKIYNQSS